MNQRKIKSVLKQFEFDYKTDINYRLLREVTNPGYFLNRAKQLLGEAELLGKDAAVDEAIKILIIWKVNQYENTKSNK